MPKAPIPSEFDGLPVVSAAGMREIDRRAVVDYRIPPLKLMENAGKAVAESVLEMLGEEASQKLVTVCSGRGNNGGDGLVAARFLKQAGCEVMVYLCPPKRDGAYSDDIQLCISAAAAAGVSVHRISEELVELDVRLRSSALIVDALLGTGSSGKPTGYPHKMIQRIMKAGKPVVAVDVPSGLNPDTGHHTGAVVTATRTCTLGLAKRGLLAAPAKRFVGEIKVLDIGFPDELLRQAGAA